MNHRNISVLIVDDEPEARELLRDLLHEIPGVKITAMASNVDDAVELFSLHNPEAVLLDIQMPDKSGFDFINAIRKLGYSPDIIFTTAYDQYAIQAIKASAFDYLLKPVNREELKASIQRLSERSTEPDLIQRMESLIEMVSRSGKIKFNVRTGYVFLNSEDIIYIEADGNYSIIHLIDEKTDTITVSLGQISQYLPGDQFFRISRSAIINLQYLAKIDRKSLTCELKADKPYRLHITKRHIRELGKEKDL